MPDRRGLRVVVRLAAVLAAVGLAPTGTATALAAVSLASTGTATALAAVGLAPTGTATALAAGGRDDGLPGVPARSDQVIAVSPPAGGGPATLSAYARSRSGSRSGARSGSRLGSRLGSRSGARGGAGWRRVLGPWPAEIGRGGLSAHRHEGDGSTPIGVFSIGAVLYGNAPRPTGLHAAYRRLRCGDWWDEDPTSPRYNTFVAVGCGTVPAFAAGSEALWTETVAYPYFAVLGFNVHPVRRGVGGARSPGSGIFLHSWVGGLTDGCVALHRAQLLRVLRWLRPAATPVVQIGVALRYAGRRVSDLRTRDAQIAHALGRRSIERTSSTTPVLK